MSTAHSLVGGINRRWEGMKLELFLRQKAALARKNARSPASEPLTVFVASVQRSGTNMLMDVLEQSLNTDVYHEGDRRAFDNYMMRDEGVISGLIAKSDFPVVVVKALHESHDLNNLMARFGPSKSVWMFRNCGDMVNSNLRNWPGGRNQIEDVVEDRLSADWRGQGMTDETHAIVREHHHRDMSDASAIALFWNYRNQLFFDQELDENDNCLLMSYEWFVTNPQQGVECFCRFLGLTPNDRMWEKIFEGSIGKSKFPDIELPIAQLSADMHRRLSGVWQAKMAALGTDVSTWSRG